MRKTYRVGLIGASWIVADPAPKAPHKSLGHNTARTHAAAFARFPQCEVVAVCDLVPERVDAFGQRWRHLWPNIRCYTDARKMLAESKPDIVTVATPDHLHTEVATLACEAGVAGILCEKPLATSLADCDLMIRAVRQHGVKMSVEHTYRWLGSYADARHAIDTGVIGEVGHVIGYLGGPRAMIFRNGTHLVDLLNYFAGGNPVWVSAELEPGFEHFREGYRGDGGRDASSEPGANAQIGYDNGVRATYIGMKGSVKDFGLTIIGTKGRITIDSSTEELTVETEYGLMTRGLQMDSTTFARREYEFGGVAGAVSDLMQAIETGGPVLSPPEEARKAVAVLLGMIESHFAGGKRTPITPGGES